MLQVSFSSVFLTVLWVPLEKCLTHIALSRGTRGPTHTNKSMNLKNSIHGHKERQVTPEVPFSCQPRPPWKPPFPNVRTPASLSWAVTSYMLTNHPCARQACKMAPERFLYVPKLGSMDLLYVMPCHTRGKTPAMLVQWLSMMHVYTWVRDT